MNKNGQYFIGDMSRICNISKKALRYYDKINLISSHREDCNNYRYYTEESLLAVPVIKYYKQMGFTLEQMKEFIEGVNSNVFRSIQSSFQAKLVELADEQEKSRRKTISVKDWHDLILEAQAVIEHHNTDVSIKFVEPATLLFQDQIYANNIKASIINIEFTKHVEDIQNEITGPVIINYSSRQARVANKDQKIKMLQKTIIPCREENLYHFGGYLMLSCYHVGAHENIPDTYRKIERWAKDSGYVLGEETFERYVTDYWTTRNRSKFVTEILIKAVRSEGAGNTII